MTESDRAQFSQILFTLAAYYDRKLDNGQIEIYWKALQPELTIDQVQEVAARLVKTSEFWPRVPAFLNGIQGNQEGRALAAWADFVDVVAGGGRRAITDPATAYAVRVTFGSVGQACAVLPDRAEFGFIAWEKRFVTNYQHALETGKADDNNLLEAPRGLRKV
jgi:hypothetical protein